MRVFLFSLLVLIGGCCPGRPAGEPDDPCWTVGGGIEKCCIDGQMFIKNGSTRSALTHVLDKNGKPQACHWKAEDAK